MPRCTTLVVELINLSKKDYLFSESLRYLIERRQKLDLPTYTYIVAVPRHRLRPHSTVDRRGEA